MSEATPANPELIRELSFPAQPKRIQNPGQGIRTGQFRVLENRGFEAWISYRYGDPFPYLWAPGLSQSVPFIPM